MTEFIAYYESSVGTYMPVIVVYRNDGSQEFKELKKSDLERLPDAFSDDGEEFVGGWLHTNSGKVGLRDNWQRRYGVFRGPYLFYFQNPKSQTPVGVVPLENCEVYTPGGGVKSFSDDHVARGGRSAGYEFEVRHSSRNKFHLSAVTESERDLWADLIQDRTGQVNGVAVKDSHKPLSQSSSSDSGQMMMQNISVTRTRLQSEQPHSISRHRTGGGGAGGAAAGDDSDDYSGASDGIFSPPPPPSAPNHSHSHSHATQQGSVFDEGIDEVVALRSLGLSASSTAPGTGTGPYGEVYDDAQLYHHQREQAQQQQQPPSQQSIDEALAHSRLRDEELQAEARAERQHLQTALASKLQCQQEGRKREAEARERSHNKQRIELARLQEARNPLTLAEMFRFLLSFSNEDLCEEADPDSPLQFPHLKGHWAENMLSSIYRSYCKTTGFMSLEEFVEFLEDTAVLRTHVPHDDQDEPLREFQSQLDPVVLLSTVPRNLGCSETPLPSSAGVCGGGGEAGSADVRSDNFRLNFAQFYQILLRITHIVYADLYAAAPAHAFNKFLQEAILPLSCWSRGHHKRGSTDTLVTDERIVLLLMTYAPNLWRVFLAYAQDCHAKVPSISSSPFPEAAKTSEKCLFGTAPGAVHDHSSALSEQPASGVFMTEASCLKFCQDYGLMPHLMNRAIMKDVIFSLNRPKTVSSRPKPKTSVPPTVFFQKTQASVIREQMGVSMKTGQHFSRPMQFSDSGRRRTSRSRHLPQHLTNPTFTLEETGGLGFSEFVELVASVALQGMEAEAAYHVLFPTPFSKILGALSVWGVADLKRLEEVRLLNSIE
jgi:hypothetical protein